jgi:hypothetical protein
MASNPTDYEFIHWLGQFALYLKAEHNADIIYTLLKNPDLMRRNGLESARFLYQNFIAGESPKDVADRLIAAVDELHD